MSRTPLTRLSAALLIALSALAPAAAARTLPDFALRDLDNKKWQRVKIRAM